jgi:LysM repeat protein
MDYILTEEQFNYVVKKTVHQTELERISEVYSKIIDDIDMSRGVHYRNMKKMSGPKKELYLNNVMERYMMDFFPKNNFIQESFNKNFTRNILFESPNRNYRKLFEFFDFFKKSVLLECGIITKKTFKTNITEQNLFNQIASGVKSVGKSIAGGVKNVVKKGVEMGKKVVSAISPYVKKFLDSEFSRFVPGVALAKVAYDANKIYQNWDKIKKMTFEDWVEEFRNFLNGATGIILQIVLALTGIGNIANWIANGFLLIYDIAYQGIGKGNWNWYNILTSSVALVATGGAAAVFKPVKGLLEGIKSAAQIGPTLAAKAPKSMSAILPIISKMGGATGNIVKWVMSAFTTFTTKFPLIGRFLKPLQGALSKIKGFLDQVVYGFQKYLKGGVLQNAPTKSGIKKAVTGGGHFDTASIAKKLLATGDKTLTKKIIGKVTKVYYKVMAGDTLDKILKKFAPQGVTASVLNQLNRDHGLEIKPGHQIRVA